MFTQAQIDLITAALVAALKSLPVTAAPPPPPPDPRLAALAALKEQMDALQRELSGEPAKPTAPPVPVPLPTDPIVPGPIVKLAPVETSKAITWSAGPSGWRVDDIVPPGTPGTVTLPKTGHTLSLPQPSPDPNNPGRGEMLMGYIARVHKQCGEPTFPQGLGALFLGTDGLFAPGRPWDAKGTYWPEAADKFYNREAYMTDAEKAAQAAANQQWDAHWAEKERQRKEQPARPQRPTHAQDGLNNPPAGEDVPIG